MAIRVQDTIFGKPLATSEERGEHIGIAAGIPIFGLDALTSAAYGPEQALYLLIPLGMLGPTHYVLPIITSILVLLVIVFFSYRQTIAAYPNGGGSYTVASENLGEGPGLLAAAALMIDYILTAAVGISAGVTAVTSVDSKLIPYTLPMCLLILAILAVINLRGVKDTGTAFILPTFSIYRHAADAGGRWNLQDGRGGRESACVGADASESARGWELYRIRVSVAADESVLKRMRRNDGC